MTRELTPEQEQIIIDSLRDRIKRLFDIAEEYKQSGFVNCQKDCLEEKRKVQKLLNTFSK